MPSSWRSCSGVSASMTCRRTLATCPGAAATIAAQPASVSRRSWRDRLRGTGTAPPVRVPRGGAPRGTAAGRVALVCCASDVIRSVRSAALGEHREDEVLEVGQSGVTAQLGVEHPWQQLGTATSLTQAARCSSSNHRVSTVCMTSRLPLYLTEQLKPCDSYLKHTTNHSILLRSTPWHTSPSSAPATWARPSPPSPARAATPSSCSARTTAPPR